MQFSTDIPALKRSCQQMQQHAHSLHMLENQLAAAATHLHGAHHFATPYEAQALLRDVRTQADALDHYIRVVTFWIQALEAALAIRYVPPFVLPTFRLVTPHPHELHAVSVGALAGAEATASQGRLTTLEAQIVEHLTLGFAQGFAIGRNSVQAAFHATESFVDGLGQHMQEGYATATNAVSTTVSTANDAFTTVRNWFNNELQQGEALLNSIIHNLVEGFKTAIEGAFNTLVSGVDGLQKSLNPAQPALSNQIASEDINNLTTWPDKNYDREVQNLLDSAKTAQEIEGSFNDDPANKFNPMRWVGGMGSGNQPNADRYNALIEKVRDAQQKLHSSDPNVVLEGKREILEAMQNMRDLDKQWSDWMDRYQGGLATQKAVAVTALKVDIAVGVTVVMPAGGEGVAGVLTEFGGGAVQGVVTEGSSELLENGQLDWRKVAISGGFSALTGGLAGEGNILRSVAVDTFGASGQEFADELVDGKVDPLHIIESGILGGAASGLAHSFDGVESPIDGLGEGKLPDIIKSGLDIIDGKVIQDQEPKEDGSHT